MSGVSQEMFDVLEEVKAYIDRSLASVHHRIGEIENKGVEYKGVYQRASDYKRGSLVTHSGSMFAAIKEVRAGDVPGTTDSWQLCVKAGRDAR